MPELKRNFATGKMNKDLDERLFATTAQGQYRDALNIQVSTTDTDDIGTAQNIMGNTQITNMFDYTTIDIPDTATVVGKVAAPDEDKIYYFVSAGDFSNNNTTVPRKRKNYIIEFDTVAEKLKYVFVDIFEVAKTLEATQNLDHVVVPPESNGGGSVGNLTGIRIGMNVHGVFTNGSGGSIAHPISGVSVSNGGTYSIFRDDKVVVKDIQWDSSNNRWKIFTSVNLAASIGDDIRFTAPSALEFDKNTLITGVNVLDGNIYWTDNKSEPKKINIDRSIKGTGGFVYLLGAPTPLTGFNNTNTSNSGSTFTGNTNYFHTRLVADVENNGYLRVVTSADGKKAVYADRKYVTVIKKGPTQPLELDMYRSDEPRINATGEENPTFVTHTTPSGAHGSVFDDGTGNLIESGTTVSIDFDSVVDFRVGDIIFFIPEGENDGDSVGVYGEITDEQDSVVRAEVITSNVAGANSLASSGFEIRILSISPELNLSAGFTFVVRKKVGEPLFEYTFARFGYRYKYQDGEYSTFSPWSQVAFLPDFYEYFPKKGFNLGMRNQLRCLKLKYYFYPEEILSQDVVEIDLLYKETNNPTVYTIKTIKKTDGHPIWPDLRSFPNVDTTANNPNEPSRGIYKVTTDLVHAVVASNQLLRPYDNVPRKAKAQEVSANRIVYANYLHNYNAQDPVISVTRQTKNVLDSSDYALPSVKSMRNYQIGVVFSDEYGRETPVLTSKEAMINFDQSACDKRNRIIARLSNGTEIPSWAKYYSFYIKETSSEYYSLAMDRWYNAADGNIWLSFPSSERNKLDEETFLILKKAHGIDQAVTQKARYKILAIENEAPDFIKTKKKDLGMFRDNTNRLIGNSTRGYPLQDTTFITIDDQSFEQVYGDDAHLEFASIDKMTIIFSGGGNFSEEYEVAKVSKIVNDNIYKIKLVGRVDSDAAFISPDDTFANGIPDLSFQLIEYQVENKPEFDGRFFVKIYKDQILEDNVVNPLADNIEYTIAATWQLRYLNNHAYTSGSYQNGDNWTDDTSNSSQNRSIRGPINVNAKEKDSSSSTTRGRHPTEFNHHSNSGGIYRWAGGSSDGDSAQLPTSGNGLSTAHIDTGSCKGLNDDSWSAVGGLSPGAREYWRYVMGKQDFFIDASTAYSWTSKEERPKYTGLGGNEKDRPGNMWANEIWTAGEMASGHNVCVAGYSASRSNRISNVKGPREVSSGVFARNGQPSRGIWFGPDGQQYMDISWTGMGRPSQSDGNSFWGTNLNPLCDFLKKNSENRSAERISEANGSTYEAAQNFIENFCTPGTMFRFRRDPDEIVYTVEEFDHPDCGWSSKNNAGLNADGGDIWSGGSTTQQQGAWGIRNYKPFPVAAPGVNFFINKDASMVRRQHRDDCKRQRWTVKIDKVIGSEGEHGYNPVTGTKAGAPTAVRALKHDTVDFDVIEIVRPYVDYSQEGGGSYTDNPAVWETEPKENVEVDIYYQIGGLNPIELRLDTNEEFLPLGSTFNTQDTSGTVTTHTIIEWTDADGNKSADTFKFTPALPANTTIADGQDIYFEKRNYYNLGCNVNGALTAGAERMKLHGTNRGGTNPLWKEYHVFDWNNCWSFLNGAESDRVRDDFNQKQMDNGVKASTVLAEPVREERRDHGFIWSGIYNSNSGVNNTNQFIMAEPITKDLNPEYGSIQKLHQRNTDLITLCEDKVLKVLSNKDALFNADGNSNVTATAKVLGAAQTYKGNYGISKNPESFVATPYQIYFGDASRGQICAMSGEGIRTISTLGMKNYFSDILKENVWQLLGTYDQKKKEYNVTIKKKFQRYQQLAEMTTISYNERSKGWVSFKSFTPQDGISLNNRYYTWHNAGLWKHHSNETRNNFYGIQYSSDITLIFSNPTASVKSFDVISYEGSQEKIPSFTTESKNFFTGNSSSNNGIDSTSVNASDFGSLSYRKLTEQKGWYVDDINTDLQVGNDIFFLNKEGKKYGYVTGKEGGIDNLDNNWNEKEFSTQGIGTAEIDHGDPSQGQRGTWTIQNNVSSSYQGDDGSGGAWDSQGFGNN